MDCELGTVHLEVSVAGFPRLLESAGFFFLKNPGPGKSWKKTVFGRGSAPDPAGGANDAPPDPLVGCGGGHRFPIPIL